MLQAVARGASAALLGALLSALLATASLTGCAGRASIADGGDRDSALSFKDGQGTSGDVHITVGDSTIPLPKKPSGGAIAAGGGVSTGGGYSLQSQVGSVPGADLSTDGAHILRWNAAIIPW